MDVSLSKIWREASAAGRWAWSTNKSYLPREFWKQLSAGISDTPIGTWNTATQTAVNGSDWHQLWKTAARQGLARKIFGLVSKAPLSLKTFTHVAYDSGQLEAGGGIEKLERLATSQIKNPRAAQAVHGIASTWSQFNMGAPSAYVGGVNPESQADVAALATNLPALIASAKQTVADKSWPPIPSNRHWKSSAVYICAIAVVLVMILMYLVKMYSAASAGVKGVLTVGAAGAIGAGAVLLAHRI